MVNQVLVGVVMGSNSDWDTMQYAVQILEQFDIPYEKQVLSAHRMPDDMFTYAEQAEPRGLKAIIAGAVVQLICQACWHRRQLCLFGAFRFPVNIYVARTPCTRLCKCQRGYQLLVLLLEKLVLQMRLCILLPCWRVPIKIWQNDYMITGQSKLKLHKQCNCPKRESSPYPLCEV